MRRFFKEERGIFEFLFSIIFILVLFSCNQTPDPSDTISATVNFTKNRHPIVLYQGISEDAKPGFYQYVIVFFGMNSSLNTEFSSVVYKDNTFTDYSAIFDGIGGEVSDIGEVDGLGDVKKIPNGGWAGSVAVQVGHGYVLRYRHSYSYTTSYLPYFYYRFYVVGWLKNVSGGIIGAKFKYATLTLE